MSTTIATQVLFSSMMKERIGSTSPSKPPSTTEPKSLSKSKPYATKSKTIACKDPYNLITLFHRFVEHQHLLIAALSSLQSAKHVIDSMT
jgi:hypothetical protein